MELRYFISLYNGIQELNYFDNRKFFREVQSYTFFQQIAFLLSPHKGPFIIYDRGWAAKIQLTTKQNVLPHPLHQ
jgi:hypothetical protein